MPGLQLRRLAVVLSCFMLCVPPVAATWSIVAVDETTGEVGAAAATCTVGVELILGLVPGRGVVVAHAESDDSIRIISARLAKKAERRFYEQEG